MTSMVGSRDGSSTVLLMLFLGGMVSYLDRAVLGILAPTISRDLSLSATELGLASSMFSVGYGLFTFAGGWAADRFGPKRTLATSMLIWSLLCGLTGAAIGVMSLLLLRLAFGAWESPFVPASNRMISDMIPRERFSFAFSISAAGQPLGGAVAGPIVGIAAAAVGWRLSFVVVAAIGIVWVIAWWQLIPASPGTRRRASPASYAESPSPSTGLLRMIGSPVFASTCLSFGAATYVMSFFLAWFPMYLSEVRGLGQVQIGLVNSVPWTLGAAGIILGGILLDRLRMRLSPSIAASKVMLGGCLIPAALCVLAVPFLASSVLSVGLMSAAIGLLGMASPTYFTTIAQIAPDRLVGRAASALVFCSTLSGILSPTISGYLIGASGGYTSSFVVAAACLLTGASIFIVTAHLAAAPRPQTT